MSLINRASNILTQPKSEWAAIDAERATIPGLFTGYALILALLPLVGTLLGAATGFAGLDYIGFDTVLTAAIVGYLLGVGVLYLMGLIANALAPSFEGARNDVSAMKLVVYAATPTWVAGFFGFVPGLGLVVSLLGFAYAAYLLYLGSMAVMKIPEAKAVGYTVVIIIIWVILSVLIVGAIVASLYGGAMLAEGPYIS